MNVVEAKSEQQVNGVEGHQMRLTCNVNSGKPKETIFWRRNGIVVSSGGPGRLQYTFVPEREDNFQNYTCTTNNTLNSIALREDIQLRLTLHPRMFVDMKEKCEKDNMTVILNCLETSGQLIESYNWVYNGASIIETSGVLVLTSSKKPFNGNYTCTGGNAAGSNNATLHLHEDKLCQPRQFPSINLNSDPTSINVSWKGGSIFKLEQPFFIEYRQHNSKIWRMIPKQNNLKTELQSIQISDLYPSTVYIIRLYVNGSNGYSVSEEYKRKTKDQLDPYSCLAANCDKHEPFCHLFEANNNVEGRCMVIEVGQLCSPANDLSVDGGCYCSDSKCVSNASTYNMN
ncbi:Hypothetical predicted protein [Mytilus galloprovincialis]|uniref:Ig-like domain-containing protein n=1 Tax=Mytilus galloprovincialis TaxID=29158 RepID=A0A8B6E2X5_MYTGA|nr:Hypothetical predicted protein [Mytilus galloprovincialis]